MRLLRRLLLVLLLIGALFYVADKYVVDSNSLHKISQVIKEKKNVIQTKTAPEKQLLSDRYGGDLFQWIGKTTKELEGKLGTPIRKDLSSYGYTWWVYTDQKEQYIQFGILNDKIQTVFGTGSKLSIDPLVIGQSYEEVNEVFPFSEEITYKKGISSYTFRLNNDDMKKRPLAKITNDLFIQCYFDTFTDKLSSVRILSGDLLLQHRPYELQYRGELPEQPSLSDDEWLQVEHGMEQQIFDITNVMRHSNQKSSLKWEEKVSEVAFLHSKDMSVNNYFSHYAQNGDGLKERLAAKEVFYFSAGENIAAQYPDAAAAMEGWLNSKGHREALLNDGYTHLGVGVYRLYYTQNFLAKP
ncbi:CAP domain-containing protein [Virgibacillus sp. MG-45]|uniref:CAP domain-containing protein n=1 Tax=Virgibacillus sp. MG-45 TaxID=3102791 RepID=UPI002EDA893F